jgi:hypothetical protein
VTTAARRQVSLCIGKAGLTVGTLMYARQGRRENCAFAYDPNWLAGAARFGISADLPLVAGYQPHKAASPQDSVFHGAIADTAPDAWGRRVIARDHAKRRKGDPDLPALTELDYLLAVDDFSRVGALRLRGADGAWQRAAGVGRRSTPPLIELTLSRPRARIQNLAVGTGWPDRRPAYAARPRRVFRTDPGAGAGRRGRGARGGGELAPGRAQPGRGPAGGGTGRLRAGFRTPADGGRRRAGGGPVNSAVHAGRHAERHAR